MITLKSIEDFLANHEVAVIGASDNKKKFGNIVLNKLKDNGYTVYPINPRLTEIDGIKCYPNIESLPETVKAAVFITKPEISEKITIQICFASLFSNYLVPLRHMNGQTSLVHTDILTE